MANGSREQQPGPLGGGGVRGAALAWVAWVVVNAALWLAFVDSTHAQELAIGALVAVIAATAAVVVRSQRHLVLRPRARWLLRAWRPIAAYPRDLAAVTVALLRRRPGRLVAVPLAVREEGPEEGARVVLMETAGSFSPNVIVVGADPDRGVLLVHQLVPRADPAAEADPLGLR